MLPWTVDCCSKGISHWWLLSLRFSTGCSGCYFANTTDMLRRSVRIPAREVAVISSLQMRSILNLMRSGAVVVGERIAD